MVLNEKPTKMAIKWVEIAWVSAKSNKFLLWQALPQNPHIRVPPTQFQKIEV